MHVKMRAMGGQEGGEKGVRRPPEGVAILPPSLPLLPSLPPSLPPSPRWVDGGSGGSPRSR